MPTSNGRLFTGTKLWFLDVDDDRYRLWLDGKAHEGDILELENANFTPGVYWTTIRLADPFAKGRLMPVVDVDGLPNEDAERLKYLLAQSIANKRQRELAITFEKVSGPALAWLKQVDDKMAGQVRRRGWITTEFVQGLDRTKSPELNKLLAMPGVAQHISVQPDHVKEGMSRLRKDLALIAHDVNERHQIAQLREHSDFFQQVEKSPLSQEQAKAVVCFESRVLLLASAGSGKTSTMIAKAGYALKNGYCEPERMLMLAFNSDAAAELRERLVSAGVNPRLFAGEDAAFCECRC